MTQLTNVIKTFVIAKLLSPAELGIVGVFLLVIEYGQYASLGVHNAFDVEYPLLAGAGRQRDADALAELSLAVTLLFGLTAIAVSLLVSELATDDRQELWILTGVVVAFELTAILLRFALRARQAYYPFSVTTLLTSIGSLSIVLIFSETLTPFIVLAAHGVGFLLSAAYSFYKIRPSLYPSLVNDYSRSSARAFCALAISLFLYNGFTLGLQSLDRVFGAVGLSTEDFGYYVFAIYLVKSASILPNSFGTILYPNILRKLARLASPVEMYSIMKSVNMIMAVTTPVIVLTVTSFVPFFVSTFVPDYVKSVPLCLIVISSVFFLTMPISCVDILVAKKRQNLLTVSTLYMIVCVGLMYSVIVAAKLLTPPVLSMMYTLSTFLYGLVFFIMAYVEFCPLRESLARALEILRIYAYMVVGFIAARFFAESFVSYDYESLLYCAICWAVSLAVYFLSLLLAETSSIKTLVWMVKAQRAAERT